MARVFVTGGSGFVGRNLIRALVARGDEVRALVRGQGSADTVESLGAIAVRGDLDDVEAMRIAMRGCEATFHCAAKVEEWGDPAAYVHVNVTGTMNVLLAARAAGMPKLVHVSTEAVLADGDPLINVTESWPYPDKPIARYPETKAESERLVLAANCDALQTVVIRPRFIWGGDDTSLLPQLVDAVTSGRFMWINGGHYQCSTTHVENVVEGLICGWQRGTGGEIYFVTDGEPKPFRKVLTELLATQGISIPDKSVPLWLIRALAAVTERIWTIANIQTPPPATSVLVALVAQEVTIDDSKARKEIGYEGKMTWEAGLAGMSH